MPSVRTLKPTNPSDPTALSASATLSRMPASMGIPVTTLVATQEFDGRSHPGRPASLERERISSLVRPHSLSGDSMPCSLSALIPGLSSSESEAFVPSATAEHPKRSASLLIADMIAVLQT